ncbi:hypothetical protein [Nesterenkonia sp. Act20]|uniref:hypothetical protein n=1 Tax=Nesterenkonia sp. Act20 TaxID=1483432 RepID=UPI001C43889C|nr:hypothetical protein [Nesterenkonia sp. Act20]
MENNFGRSTPSDAADALGMLSVDRERLAARVRVPRILVAALGAMAAWWVSSAAFTSPGENYEPPTSSWMALVGALVILYLIRRETGVRFKAMGARAGWAVAGILVLCLSLFSISLGLVSFGLHWVVALTSLLAFAATTWLAGVAFRSAVERLRSA